VDSLSEDFPEGGKAALLSSSIKQKLVRLAELDVIRSSSMSKQRQATAARQSAHRLLDSMVRTAVGTADVIALDHPDIKGMFVRPQKNSSGQTLIADARALAEKTATLVSLFTENSLPPTFTNEMRSHADSLEHAIQRQTESVGERVRANAEMKVIIRELKELVGRLNIIVRNKYAKDPAKLAAWESASRLEHPAHSKHGDENNAPPPAPQQ